MTIPTGEYISRSQAPEVEPEIEGHTINDFVEMLQDVKPISIISEIDEYNDRNNTDIIPEQKAILIEYLNKFNDIENELKSITRNTTKETRLEIYKRFEDIIDEASSKFNDLHEDLWCEYDNEDKLYEKHLAECNDDDEEYNRREANGEYDVDDDNINKFICKEIVRSIISLQEELGYGLLNAELTDHIRSRNYDNKDYYKL